MRNTVFSPGGCEHIRQQIAEAIQNGSRTATVTGCWEIESAVRIPSDFTLILDGCHLKMADGVYENLFVNEHHDTDLGKTPAGTDRNIAIRGRNGAILDGGTYNGLSERNQQQNGLPPIWKNNLILFTNVDGLEISGLSCHNQRWWALNFIYCANGRLCDLDFRASDIGIDENGNAYHGLKHERYGEVLVKNADGIDLRQGCHDFVIENITGFTEDDSVALTGLNGSLEQTFAVTGLPADISNVTIRNVSTAAFCANVRLLNQGGTKLHHIFIDGVTDTSADSPCLDYGIYAVRVGDTHLYGARHATADETYDITIRNVFSRAAGAAVALAGDMRGLVLENITVADGTRAIEDHRGA